MESLTKDLKPKPFSFDFIRDIEPDDGQVEAYEKKLKDREAEIWYENYKKTVPQKFWEESFETYSAESAEQKKALEEMKAFAENPRNRVMILCGNNGNGKSHLVCSVLRVHGGTYARATDICVIYDACGSFKSTMSREEYLKKLTTDRLLVIDEGGKFSLNPDLEKFILSYVLSVRYDNNLPTVIVTNGNKKSFIEFLGKSVFDRLTEVCTTIEFTWESYRIRKRISE